MDIAEHPIISVADFEALLRITTQELKSFLQEIEIRIDIPNTKSRTCCHLINLNANGQVRFKDFAQFLATKVLDFAIPRSQIDEAHAHYSRTASNSKLVALHKQATTLFTMLKKSGEGGEILLYLLIEEILKVPQVLCKMNLKTSGQVHVHGCDGIHASYVDETGLLQLYWGESKLYKTLNAGLNECFKSISTFLTDTGGSDSAQERDIQLIKSYIDLNNEKLENAITAFLDKDNENFNKVSYKGACLIGFDYSQYPSTSNSGMTNETLKNHINAEIATWKKSISKKILDSKLDSFELEIFLLPFPSVEDFRAAFLSELGINRGT